MPVPLRRLMHLARFYLFNGLGRVPSGSGSDGEDEGSGLVRSRAGSDAEFGPSLHGMGSNSSFTSPSYGRSSAKKPLLDSGY
mmetsp:Transcript_8170/g.19918  ORF Transcript_8170/g.19918 Transcript_8170/m.19918 type:complete len:82 (+) Transcript_8170:1-246(+)